MKTLIIAGTYKSIEKSTNKGTSFSVHYNVSLFGQTKEAPLMVCFGFIDTELRGFEHLQEIAREKYSKWFNVSQSDIISMEVLNERHRIIK